MHWDRSQENEVENFENYWDVRELSMENWNKFNLQIPSSSTGSPPFASSSHTSSVVIKPIYAKSK